MKRFQELINKKLQEKQMTMYRLSKLTKLNKNTIQKIMSSTVKTSTLSTAVKIAKVLDIDLNELKKGGRV